MVKPAILLSVLCLMHTVCLGATSGGSFVFTTVAGTAGAIGSTDGTNAQARFNFPGGLAFDSQGNCYVADILNHTVRQIAPSGTNWLVTTIVGLAGTIGSDDGTNSDARFDRPNAVAVNADDDLFVTDHYNHTIRKVTRVGTNWVVTTIAGQAALHGSSDGTNSQARFWSPTGIALDAQGRLYVVDTANFTVRQITPSGTNWIVRTIAGLPLNYGFVDGTNATAQFDYPYGITVAANGWVYVTDWGNNAIREVAPEGTNWIVRTIAGNSGVMGSNDGLGTQATFNLPNSICSDQAGGLYVTDQANDTVRQLVATGNDWMVSTVAGTPLQAGTADGPGQSAQFRHPWGIATDRNGDLFVADYGNHTIRKGTYVPWLQIRQVPQRIVLSWPAAAVGYRLEISSQLGASEQWTVAASPAITNGDSVIVTISSAAEPAFYRLHRP